MKMCIRDSLVAAQPVPRAQRVGFEVCVVGLGTGGHIAQRGAGLRFAQAHGAEPAAGKQGLGEDLALRGRAMRHQQAGIAAGQHGITAQRHAGLAKELSLIHI